MVAQSDLKKYPCPSCGAFLNFNPSKNLLKCEYCGWEDKPIKSTAEVKEHSYEEYLNIDRRELIRISTTALEIDCDRCGASITFEPPQTAGKCAFCAADLVTQPKLAAPTLAPEGIIPFAIGRKKARQELITWLSKKWLAPNELKKLAQLERIKGVYLPFWTYDCQTITDYTGQRGEYYYTTETYTETNADGEEEEKTREVRHTSWHSTSGRVQRFFDDVLIAATKSLNHKQLDALEPWHLQTSLRPYEPSYLAGFEAQRPQIQLKEGFILAKEVMNIAIERDIRHDIGGDEQRINSVSTAYSAITFKHILLPVWLTSYRYRNQQYQVMINANTGEVQGDCPLSFWKVTIILEVIIGIVTTLKLVQGESNFLGILFCLIVIELISLLIIKIFWIKIAKIVESFR